MKVFEVIFDYCPNDSKEIMTEVNYWTAPDLMLACNVASRHAFEYEKDLKCVREVITVTRQIDKSDWSDAPDEDEEKS